MTDAAEVSKPSSAPARQGLVLTTLILVAAVANLNLVGRQRRAAGHRQGTSNSSQTTLDLIAVGYSLGLACSVLWLGALGDRYGRKLMLLTGHGPRDPAVAARGVRARAIGVLFIARIVGGARGRHGLPDDARADHGAVVGTRAHQVDRAVVGHRRRDRRRSARCCRGAAARAPRLGLGLPAHAAARGGRDLLVLASCSCPPTSTRPPSRSTTSAGSSRSCWSAR